jgi:hypothetical protein
MITCCAVRQLADFEHYLVLVEEVLGAVPESQGTGLPFGVIGSFPQCCSSLNEDPLLIACQP